MNVAIIGASGIGKFHTREFIALGANVKAVLGSTKESSEATAKVLKDSFDVAVKPYNDLKKLIKEEKLDAAAVCVPLERHYSFTKLLLSAGVNVLCEKPFTQDIKEAKELFGIAKTKKIILTVNTQWVSMLDVMDYKAPVKDLEIKMQSGLKGKEMLVDHLPHMNSFLLRLCGFNEASNIKIKRASEENVEISFVYARTNVKYVFGFNPNRPREISLKINGNVFSRKVYPDYSQSIISGKKEIKIEDPLRTSIKKFLEAVNGKGKSLIDEKEVLENLKLQERIISYY